MIPGETLAVAESLARFARNSNLPWGGMRVIAVGDFAQLPPVTKTAQRDWSFTHDVWHKTGFSVVELHHNQRVDDDHFLKILGKIRIGHVDKEVMEFLNSKICVHNDEDESIRLFPRREQADQLNNKKLEQIQKPSFTSHSLFLGSAKHIEILKKNSPLPDCLTLKEGCQVMLLQNDPAYRWVNGTRGTVVEIAPDKIRIEKSRGRLIEVEKVQFGLQDAEGNTLASVINFPLRLAYATTIHKSQGATLDNLWVDLRRLWEPGHAYVALSRLSQPSGLKLLGWNSKSISVDPQVLKFYSDLKLNREDPTSPEL
jgi:ATP-dependent exoDNAse (exonuclease V) alpha subunit